MGFSLKGALLGLVAIGLAGVVALDAGANALRNRLPKEVSAFPGESQAQVIVMNDRFMMKSKAPPPEKTFPVARRALRDEPLNAAALRLMAFSVDSTGRAPQTVKLAELASKVTRRDFFTQLVLIDASVRRNQTREALEHYDAALRVSPGSQQVVFPILKRALVSPGIRQNLSRYFIARSPWALDFISFAALDPKSVGLMGDVVLKAGKGMHRDDLAISGPLLLTRLLEARQYANAPRVLALLPDGDPKLFSRADLSAETIDPRFGMASWMINGTATSSSTFIDDAPGGKKKLSIYAAPGARAIAASKLLFMPPGTYAMTLLTETVDAVKTDQKAYWRLVCASGPDTKIFWQSENFLPLQDRSNIKGIVIPSQCRQQRLDLIVQVDFDGQGLELTLSDLQLTRTSNAVDLPKPATPKEADEAQEQDRAEAN